MNILTLEKLRPYTLRDRTEDKNVENYYHYFPEEYLNFIKSHPGKIGFSNGAILECSKSIPYTDGIISIDFLYGDSNGTMGLNYNIQTSFNIMPNKDYLSFAECPGGDKICLNKHNGEIFYFWHESPSEKNCFYYLSKNFKEFLLDLKPEEENKKNGTDKLNVRITLDQDLLNKINKK